MYLLDTNVISEIRKIEAGRANLAVEAWAGKVGTDQAYLSAITIQELEMGTLMLLRRDPVSGAVLRRWLDNDVYQRFDGHILSVDSQVARIAATLHVPDPAPFGDALIAATALVHGMTVVTRNIGDFQRFEGVRILNPWEAAL